MRAAGGWVDPTDGLTVADAGILDGVFGRVLDEVPRDLGGDDLEELVLERVAADAGLGRDRAAERGGRLALIVVDDLRLLLLVGDRLALAVLGIVERDGLDVRLGGPFQEPGAVRV